MGQLLKYGWSDTILPIHSELQPSFFLFYPQSYHERLYFNFSLKSRYTKTVFPSFESPIGSSSKHRSWPEKNVNNRHVVHRSYFCEIWSGLTLSLLRSFTSISFIQPFSQLFFCQVGRYFSFWSHKNEKPRKTKSKFSLLLLQQTLSWFCILKKSSEALSG